MYCGTSGEERRGDMSGASAGEGLLVCCMAYAAAGIATRGLLVCFMAYAPAKAGGASCSRLAEVCWQMRPMHGFLRMPAPPNLLAFGPKPHAYGLLLLDRAVIVHGGGEGLRGEEAHPRPDHIPIWPGRAHIANTRPVHVELSS